MLIMVATYRGIKYNTDVPKTEYINWWNTIHHDASKKLIYRGQVYRPAALLLQDN